MKLENGSYQVDGISLAKLADQYGTPLYVYSAARIEEQIVKLRTAFMGVPLRIKYALKALSNSAILKVVRRAGAEVDTVAIEEVEIALRAGFAPEQILFTPNCVAFPEYQRAVELGVMINIDSLPILEKFGETYGATVPCCVRLNPHIVAGGNEKIQVAHADSKFGISTDQLADIESIVQKYSMNVVGVHVHTGSDVHDPAFLESARIVFDVARRFSNLRFIDFGGGFKVPYKPTEKAAAVTDLARDLVPAFRAFCDEYGREIELWFEPGKFIVSECGYLLVRANVVKQTPTTKFVGVDSGLNHLIRPMFYGSYHQIINISNPTGRHEEYSVVGYICETDTFATKRELNEVREGDVLVFLNGGAYGITMSSNYNSRPRPAEVLIIDGEPKLIRRRESLEDVLRTEIPISV